MMSEILPNLFIGDWQDAQQPFDGFIFNVLENPPPPGVYPSPNVGWVPILKQVGNEVRADRGSLDIAADNIESALNSHGRVLVHCGAGIERSPLVVAWFLHRKLGMTMDDAYALIISKRLQVQRRDFWVGP